MRTPGIAAAVVAALAAACPAAATAAWGPAFDVSPPGGASTGRSSAVVPAPGARFVVAWTAGSRVQARRIATRATGRVLTLAAAGGAVSDVRLWPAPDGGTVATWAQPAGASDVAIRMRTIGADDRLGPAVTVTRRGDDGRDVVAVPRRDGSTTVAWIERTGAVQARRVPPAGRPGPVTTLTAPADRAGELVGAPDIDDGAMLVWNAGGTLFGRRITAAGAAARPAFQISGQGETAGAVQLATDGTGGATAVWVQGTAPTSVQEVAIISDDKLSGLDQLSAAGVPALAPSLAFRGLAGVVVWEARPATGAVVVGVDADGRRSTLSRPDAGAAGLRPDAAIDAAGRGFAVWQRGRAVQVARFGQGLRRRVTTLSDASSRTAAPHVAAAPGGRALAIWVRATSAGTRVQGAVHGLRLAKRGSGR